MGDFSINKQYYNILDKLAKSTEEQELNEKEFAIKSYIWNKDSMPQPQLYRLKMKLAQRFKDVERYTILDIELVNIAVQLFQFFNYGPFCLYIFCYIFSAIYYISFPRIEIALLLFQGYF